VANENNHAHFFLEIYQKFTPHPFKALGPRTGREDQEVFAFWPKIWIPYTNIHMDMVNENQKKAHLILTK